MSKLAWTLYVVGWKHFVCGGCFISMFSGVSSPTKKMVCFGHMPLMPALDCSTSSRSDLARSLGPIRQNVAVILNRTHFTSMLLFPYHVPLSRKRLNSSNEKLLLWAEESREQLFSWAFGLKGRINFSKWP